MTRPHPEITPSEARLAVEALATHGSVRSAAAAMGWTRPACQRRLRAAERWGITAHGEVMATQARPVDAQAGRPRRYLFTAAQSNTRAHPGFWRNLQALAAHYGADILVARIRYNHTPEQIGQEKTGRKVDGGLWYDADLLPFMCDDRVEVAPGLIWAGDMNVIPTATDPLSGLDSFTGLASCIFPHPQIALKSVATGPGRAAKFNFTTGAVTLKNYIRRKAGLKAEFHHAFGALLVEVDAAGQWWARQINATEDGGLCDLDIAVDAGRVTTGHRAASITAEPHGTLVDPVAAAAVWGPGGIVDVLRPAAQVLHDVLNFGARSHHNGPLEALALHYAGAESVEAELAATARLVASWCRPDCATYIAKANHDEHLDRWVREADWRRDPVNAAFLLEAASAVVAAIRAGQRDFDLAAWALKRAGVPEGVVFLTRADRLEIAGIRHDLHGDLGPNGSRGALRNLSRLGEKTNSGHAHTAGIFHGAYQAPTLSLLDMGYNRGPSSWSQGVIVTYGNGKRAILTINGGKWRVDP